MRVVPKGNVAIKASITILGAAALVGIGLFVWQACAYAGSTAYKVDVLLDEVARAEAKEDDPGWRPHWLPDGIREFLNDAGDSRSWLEVARENARQIIDLGTNAIPRLEHALQNRRRDATRRTALSCVARIGSVGSGEIIADVLTRDSSPRVRRDAAYALRGRPPEISVPALCSALAKDSQADVRSACVSALCDIGDAACLEALQNRLLDDASASVRRDCAMVIGCLGSVEHAQALMVAVEQDRDELVRATAVKSLGQLRSETTYGALLATMKHDESSRVRAAASASLGCFERLESLRVLTSVFRGETNTVAASAVQAIGRLGCAEADSVLTEALSDERVEVRMSAVLALGERGMVEFVPALTEMFERSDDVEMRKTITKSISLLVDDSALEFLLGAARDQEPEVRQAAIRGLGHLGAASAVPAVLAELRDGSVSFEEVFALAEIGDESAGSDLRELVSSRSGVIRVWAAYALAFGGDDDGLHVLEQALEAGRGWGPFLAIVAIARLDSPEALDVLRGRRARLSLVYQALADRILDGQGVTAFLPMLGTIGYSREKLLVALALFNDPATRSALVELADDESCRVAATVALRRMDRVASVSPPLPDRGEDCLTESGD